MIWYLIPLFLLLLFFIAYRFNRTWLIPGFVLTCAITSFIGVFFLQAYYSDSRIMRLLSIIPILLIAFLLTYSAYVLIVFLFFNTRLIVKREKRGMNHFLTLFLAIGLIILLFIRHAFDFTALPQNVEYFFYSIYGLIIYFTFQLVQYIISVVLCNFTHPHKNQHYILVLGCWIKNGQVTPILAKRMDKAIEFYKKQVKVHEPPKLILSGGQGSDEICSEAEAMKKYALEKGIPEEHILMEEKSTSTFENMKFSKEIMEKDTREAPYRCIYTTSNYHLLRAGIYARKAGLRINGIGAKTAFYYLPNAILREYIAYVFMHIKWNIVFSLFILIVGTFVLPIIMNRYF